MAVGFPAKTNFATGDVLTATNMNDVTGTLNLLQSTLYPAGRNKIINGDFGVNQRAFTSTTANITYTFDRWRTTVAGDGTSTFSKETLPPGDLPAQTQAANFMRIVTTGQTTTGVLTDLTQRIESVGTLAGQTVTVSFYAKAASGTPSIAPFFVQAFGASGSANVETPAGKTAITTSWARYSFTVAIPSITGKTIGTGFNDIALRIAVSAGSDFNTRTSSLGIQSNTFDIWGVQLEAGSTASPFQTASGSIGGELALCQRYYWRLGVPNGGSFSLGQAYSITNALGSFQFPVTMRTAPTALEQNGTAANYGLSIANLTFNDCTAVPVYNTATVNNSSIVFISTGVVAGNATHLVSKNAAAYLAWSAEL